MCVNTKKAELAKLPEIAPLAKTARVCTLALAVSAMEDRDHALRPRDVKLGSAPGGTRTLNLSVRSALLYPIELPGRSGVL